MNQLDDCNRLEDIRARIHRKKSLFKLYKHFYQKYLECLDRCEEKGIVVELGSGGGFLKDTANCNVFATDILPYITVDIAMDATRMPFGNNTVKSFFLLNTLHHIPNPKCLFNEIVRCLMHKGRVLIIDQYCGWLSSLIYKYLHHEPFDPFSKNWDFKTTGPLSGANGALCWIMFYRDRSLFEELYPSLKIVNSEPNTPLRYWLSGGLKPWNLLPVTLFNASTKLDNWLSQKFPDINSFVEIEIVKIS
jgi:SAM-dependent methyltransferase